MEKTLKVLVISYDFYPDKTPNTFRWLSVLKEWEKRGVKVFVLSAVKNNLDEFEEYAGLHIYRTGESFIGRLKYNYRNDLSENKKQVENILFRNCKTAIRHLYDLTWAKLYWPDFAFLWYFSAASKAKEIIKKEGIEKIITVSWPFTDHLIGYSLKKEFQNLFWLADTIDPFSFHDGVNNHKIYGRLNTLVEKHVFDRVDVLSVLTERIKSKYINCFPRIESKINVNKNLYIPVNFDFKKEKTDNKIKLVFVGSLIEKVRTPDTLLFLFEKILAEKHNLDIELHFYGDINTTRSSFDKYSYLLEKSIFLHGRIEKEAVNDVIKDSDVLINIGNNNEFQEPSKVIEYMFSGKKIINICSITNDSSSVLLEKYPLKINIYPNELNSGQIVNKISKFLSLDEQIPLEELKLLLNGHFLECVQNKYFTYLWGSK